MTLLLKTPVLLILGYALETGIILLLPRLIIPPLVYQHPFQALGPVISMSLANS